VLLLHRMLNLTAPAQGMSADLTRRTVVTVVECIEARSLLAPILATVHDELLLEVRHRAWGGAMQAGAWRGYAGRATPQRMCALPQIYT